MVESVISLQINAPGKNATGDSGVTYNSHMFHGAFISTIRD